jgi:chorismate dehydratase
VKEGGGVVWRLGVVPYLNADPLTAALREPDASLLVGDAVQVRSLVPSRLIDALLDGEVDAALVSTAAVLPHPELRILPGMGVASHSRVRSIELYCRRPLPQVRKVALDASSRSGVALTRVLFAERWGLSPEWVTLPPELPLMLEQADAGLLIGNPALLANERLASPEWSGPAVETYDLGAEWRAETRLPFVYAVWAAPADRDLSRLEAALRRSLAWGLKRIPLLAHRGAQELGLPLALTEAYLTEAIHYQLGDADHAGMERFCELAVRHGVLPAGSAVRLVRCVGA